MPDLPDKASPGPTGAPRPARVPAGAQEATAEQAAAPEATAEPAPALRSRPKRRSGGVSVVAGGLLQDLEDRMRRDLAPIEERVRPGEETRGVAGCAGGPAGEGRPAGADDPLVIILPAAPAAVELDRG